MFNMSAQNGKFDMGRYVTIPETKNIKLPIGGKIRLGIKTVNEQGVEHPLELPYFVCPKEIKAIFGDEPTELTVYFPRASREEVFPQAYEKYGSNNALLCKGDGEVSKTAQRLNLENGRWEDVVCPCEHYGKKFNRETKIGGCSKVGHLYFMIPEVSIGTFYECSTHGTVSISELNSAFHLADITTGGCWAMIPFKMQRVPKKLKIPGTAKMKTHWVITLEVMASPEEIRRVMNNEILYLGQLKNGKYEIEAPGLPDANKVYPRELTEEEEEEKAAEIAKKREAEKVFLEQQKLNEEQLKKDKAAGKKGTRTPAEAKAFREKREKFEADLKKEIEEYAVEYGINKWADLIELGRRYKIFHEGIFTWHTALDELINHPEKVKEFKEKIKTDQEIATDDIPF